MSRVIQMLYVFSYGDAIANHTIAIHKKLAEKNIETKIYAEIIDERIREYGDYVREYKPLEDDVIIYHLSTGCELNKKVAEYPGKLIIDYHNITPPDFFHSYNQSAEMNSRNGIEEAKALRDRADYAIADSDYNAAELREYGYKCNIETVPIIMNFSDYRKEPDEDIINKYKESDTKVILFVGRIAPNKKQEDIIRDFYCYSKQYNANSQLVLIGNYNNFESYYLKLKKYVKKLGLTNVLFPGHIKFSEILAYYSVADVFVCESEHEGFCVPLLEAMNFHVPIIAYNSSAVGETLGNAGILVDEKDPQRVAALMDKMINDQSLREKYIVEEEKRLSYFRSESHLDRMIEIIHQMMNKSRDTL